MVVVLEKPDTLDMSRRLDWLETEAMESEDGEEEEGQGE